MYALQHEKTRRMKLLITCRLGGWEALEDPLEVQVNGLLETAAAGMEDPKIRRCKWYLQPV